MTVVIELGINAGIVNYKAWLAILREVFSYSEVLVGTDKAGCYTYVLQR